ncbi:hypothetical protein [Streptomyces sp. NBC_01408]|uniref:hypothetical protein n=1 Tax=Streptomyces sp. NBC_01408 TaxID=2903855 RepID=UPI00225B6C9D|nr:hypothetical protein [Streptomyces sp. NBC_01408]MCX4696981.1 hypothetical protein [Streptomyces sp. NBC_01408]
MSRARGAWNTKGTWAAVVALAATLILTAYAMLGGIEDTDADAQAQAPAKGGASPSSSVSGPASPEETYVTPDDWTGSIDDK